MPYGPKDWKMKYDPIEERHVLVPSDWEYHIDYDKCLEIEKQKDEEFWERVHRKTSGEISCPPNLQRILKSNQNKINVSGHWVDRDDYNSLSPDGKQAIILILDVLDEVFDRYE